MIKVLAAAAITASAFISSAAFATPLPAAGAIQAQTTSPAIERVQYRDRVVTTRRVVRPARRCVVRIQRTRTPRGVIVRKVRTCR